MVSGSKHIEGYVRICPLPVAHTTLPIHIRGYNTIMDIIFKKVGHNIHSLRKRRPFSSFHGNEDEKDGVKSWKEEVVFGNGCA